MKVYEVVFDPEKDAGVYAMGCVERPAMEDVWLTLSEHPKEVLFSAVDDEKRILLGAAIIPNKKIYRKIDGQEFYVVFKEETVEKLAHNFFKNEQQNNASEDHKFKIDGCTVVESWVVEDPQNDKSGKFGKEYEKGTWVIMMKVDNDDTWQKAKEGKLTGFSIEAFFGLKETELNIVQMEKSENKKTVTEQIKEGFAALLSGLNLKPVELKQMKLKDGAVIEFEGESLEEGKPVFGLSKDKSEKFKMPKGVFELEDGNKIYIDENSLVAKAPESENEEEVAEANEAVAELSLQVQEAFKQLNKKFDERIEQIEAKFALKLASEKEKNEELENELSKVPADDKIDTKLNVEQNNNEQPEGLKAELFSMLSKN